MSDYLVASFSIVMTALAIWNYRRIDKGNKFVKPGGNSLPKDHIKYYTNVS